MAIVLDGTTGITNDGGYTGDGVVFADTTPANTLVTTTGGNVGIGTSSPSYKLDVQGSVGVTISSKTAEFNAAGGSIYSSYNDGTKTWRVGAGIQTTGMFSIRNQTDAIGAVNIDSSGNFQFNSGYGSAATAYGCRAWVNFNGTGTIAINASGNVSSLQDIGVGNYRINLTTGMPDGGYAVSCLIGNSGTGGGIMTNGGANSTSQVYLYTNNSSGTLTDYTQCQLAVFR